MSLTKTPICDFGKKADDFRLKSTENKIVSLNEIKGERNSHYVYLQSLSVCKGSNQRYC